ncbi:MAG: tetratricopeptide repeat protein [Myxococcota bacterium]
MRGLAIEPTSDLEAAETLLRDAYELALHAGARDVALRAAQSIAGAIVRGTGRLEAAKAFVDIALGLSQNLNDEREAASLRQLGSVLQMSARYEESVEALTEAIELYAQHLPANSPRIANARGSLGVSHVWLGDLGAAEVELTRALAALRETLGPSHPQTLPGLDALGLLKTKLGHPTEGERLHREAIARRIALFGDRHAGHSESFTNLGVALNRQARYRDAERYFRKALDLDRSLRGTVHPSVGIDLVDIGAARLEQGDRSGAQRYLTQALALFERHGELYEAMALGAAHLSTVLAQGGRLQEAEQKAQRATSICEAITCEPEVLARVRWAAARVGSRRHGFDDTQRQLAKLAHQGFEAEHLSREAAQVTAWLQRRESGSQRRKTGD